MAFTTIPGTNGSPTTFQGTDGADSVVITGGSTTDITLESFVANGEAGDDFVNFTGNRANSTIRGGQGNDLITQNIVGGGFDNFFASGLINGNLGDDVIGNNQLGIAASNSTISGGQSNDILNLGTLQNSIANGNLGDDALFIDDTNGLVNINGSSVFGGQGNDLLSINTGVFGGNINNTKIAGNLGDDVLLIDADGPSFAGSIITGDEGDDLIDADSLTSDNPLGISLSDLNMDGGVGDDTVYGGNGDDTIKGFDGADLLAGGGGEDVVDGAKGDDIIAGASFNNNQYFGDGIGDVLSGGTGSNVFVVRSEPFSNNLLGSSAFAEIFDDNPDGVISQGDTIDSFGVTNAFDVITDWSAAAATNLFSTGIAGIGTFATVLGGATMSLGTVSFTGLNYAVQGDYNATNGVFVVNQFGGGDIAVWNYDTVGAGPRGTTTNVTILLDVNPSQTGIFVQENDFTASV